MLEKFLTDIGFNEKEARVYLYLVTVDYASPLEIARKTGIKRPTVYLAVKSLAKKGLVSETTVGKKTRFQAEPAERLITYVEQQKLMLEEREKRLADVIPQIKSIQRESGEKPVVKYYEEREGILSSIEDFFLEKTDDETYFIYPKDIIDELFPKKVLDKFRSKRIDQSIKSKVLYTFREGSVQSDSTGERIKLDADNYRISCDIAIYGDKVRITTLGKSLAAILIRSSDFAETFRTIFLLAFEEAKRRNPPAQSAQGGGR